MTDVIKFIIDNHLGELASVVALIVTAIGFVVTIWNVLKSKSAAQAAEKAIRDVREDIAQFDAVTELSAALATIDEIKNLHRGKGWQYISPRYSSLRKSLMAIRAAHPDMSSQDKARLQGAVPILGQWKIKLKDRWRTTIICQMFRDSMK